MLQGPRRLLAGWALGAARRAAPSAPQRAERWLRIAAGWAPEFGDAHRGLIAARQARGDPLGAVEIARRWTLRFEHTADAWVTLGNAWAAAFRTREALWAYERALQLEERADAAMAAGALYRRLRDPATAGARFARAYAAGAGAEALRENARALREAGDTAAAAEAIALWERETGERWEEPGSRSEGRRSDG